MLAARAGLERRRLLGNHGSRQDGSPSRDRDSRWKSAPARDSGKGTAWDRVPPQRGARMKITDILVREASILDLVATTKDDLLAELAGALAGAEGGLDRDDLLRILREREALQSTGIGEGVAIPHGKMHGLDHLVATFARSKAGVDFESIDGQPTQLFFLLVVPEQSGGQHLKALARISRFFRDASFREKLLGASDLDEIFRAIEEEDAKF